MTGAALKRRLLRGRLGDIWRNSPHFPLAAIAVLDSMLTLIAESDDGLCYHRDPSLAEVPVARIVASRIERPQSEDEVTTSLEILVRLGFLLSYDDGSYRAAIQRRGKDAAPLAVTDLDSHTIAGLVNNLFSPGPPRKGEDKHHPEFVARKEAKRAGVQAIIDQKVGPPRPGETEDQHRVRILVAFGKIDPAGSRPAPKPAPVQQSLMLPTATAKPRPSSAVGDALANTLRSSFADANDPNWDPEHPKPTSEAASQTASQSAAGPGSASESSLPAAAAAAFSDNSVTNQAAAAASETNPRAGDAHAEDPKPHPNEHPSEHPKGVSQKAQSLASHASKRWGYATEQKRQAPGIMQGYLDSGVPPEIVSRAIDRAKHKHNGAGYYRDAIADLMAERQASGASPPLETGVAAAAVPLKLHPRFEENPTWKNLPVLSQTLLNRICEAMDLQDPVACRDALKRVRPLDRSSGCLDLVERRYPAIKEMIDYNSDWEEKRRSG